MKMKQFFGMVGVAGACFLAATAYSELAIKTTEYALDTEKTDCPVTVTVLSDMHFSQFGKDNCRLIEAVRNTQPDLIFLAGDFFDYHGGKSNADDIKKLMTALCEICDVYMVPGNHDYRYNIRTGENCLEYARSCGVNVFDGEYADINVKGQNFRIGGVFDHSVYEEDYGELWYKSDVYKYLKEFEATDAVKLLMLHRPNTFIYTNDQWDIDAVFCGHDHGGIWQIPLLGGVYAPEQGFLPDYDKGEYSFGKMKMFLSAGLEGYYLIPRLFNRVEILKITIN